MRNNPKRANRARSILKCYGLEKIEIKYLIFLVTIFLAGCSSFGGAKGTPYDGLSEFKPGHGQVYIYRPSHFVMSLAIPTLKVDGKTALSVRNGSYMVYDLPPGTHSFAFSHNGNWVAGKFDFTVNVQENERQFFRLSTDFGSVSALGPVAMVTLNGYLGQVTEKFAKSEMQGLLFTGRWP